MTQATVYELWQQYHDGSLPLGMPQNERDIQRFSFYMGAAAVVTALGVPDDLEMTLSLLRDRTLKVMQEIERAILGRQYGPEEDKTNV